jgi:hypothetical protein
MKRSTLTLLIGVGLIFLWYRDFVKEKSKAATGENIIIANHVSATYIGQEKILGTYVNLENGDLVKGILNTDGSLTYSYMTSYGGKTIKIPSTEITNIIQMV